MPRPSAAAEAEDFKALEEQVYSILTRVRMGLVADLPFLGSLGLTLKLVLDWTAQTMWVDGVHLGYNPKFVLSCTPSERAGVFLHEILHCMMGHPWRRGDRDPELWNIACDLAINYLIERYGFKLPEGALREARFDGKAAEVIYNTLEHERQQQQDSKKSANGNKSDKQDEQSSPSSSNGSPSKDAKPGDEPGQASGGGKDEGKKDEKTEGTSGSKKYSAAGEVRDVPKDVEPAQVAEDWRKAITLGATVAHAMGKLPGSLKREIEDALKPLTSWADVVQEFLERSHAREDWTMARPNRRYLYQDLYMPTLVGQSMPCMVIITDTSGSIFGGLLGEFKAGINAVRAVASPDETVLIYSDAAVHKTQSFTADEDLAFEPVGGGGTDFRPAFKWIDQEGLNPTCVIYLTDLEGTFPDREPDYPVLWVSPKSRITPPWGEHVTMY